MDIITSKLILETLESINTSIVAIGAIFVILAVIYMLLRFGGDDK